MTLRDAIFDSAMKGLREDLEKILNRDRLPISGNVPADIAEKLSDQPSSMERFNEWDDDHLGAILDPGYVEPVGDLLQLRAQIEWAQRIEGLDKARAFDLILPMLDKLYRACVEEYRQL